MAASGTFELRCERVSALINGQRNLDPAHRAARTLVADFPDRAQGYFLLNLVTCIGNKGGGARYTEDIIARAKQCPDYTSSIGGDMLRDRIIGLIRFAIGSDLRLAEGLITEVRQLHAGDGNRLACLTGIEGQLAFARREYRRALDLHQHADDSWRQLGNQADQTWVYLNLIQWLRAEVALCGRKSELARELNERIRKQRPRGSREAQVICLPWIGLKTYHWFLQHR